MLTEETERMKLLHPSNEMKSITQQTFFICRCNVQMVYVSIIFTQFDEKIGYILLD